MGVWGRWRLDHVRRYHGVMSRSSSHDRIDEFDVMLDDMSDMDGRTVEPCDLDAELSALSGGCHTDVQIPLMNGSGGCHTDVPIPLMNGSVTDTPLCTDADTLRRMLQPVLHPGIGHYARNCKTGAAAALPPVKTGADAALSPMKTGAAAALPPKTVKKVPSNSVDTLKKFQSREFKKASTLATAQGLSDAEVKLARQAAYKNATASWNARHAS